MNEKETLLEEVLTKIKVTVEEGLKDGLIEDVIEGVANTAVALYEKSVMNRATGWLNNNSKVVNIRSVTPPPGDTL